MTAEIAAVLACYFPHHTIADCRVSPAPSGFSGAGVWKVDVGFAESSRRTDLASESLFGSPRQSPRQTLQAKASNSTAAFALRRWPSPGLPPIRLRGLHRLLHHLADAGLPFVAAPVRGPMGETLLALNDRHWQLEPWLPGTADFHANPTEQRLRSTMTALARWHAAAAKFPPDPSIREWFGSVAASPSPAVRERLARWRRFASGWNSLRAAIRQEPQADRRELAAEMLDSIASHRDAVVAQLESLSRQTFALQPCLRDIWHDHVLFTGDEVSGLIDPSACRMENIATDLARLLGSLVEDDASQWQTALDEYRNHHPLTWAEEALIGALDQSGVVLSAATWLEWLFVERRAFPDESQVNDRLQWLHRRLRSRSARVL